MPLPDSIVKSIRSQFLSTGLYDIETFGKIAIETTPSPDNTPPNKTKGKKDVKNNPTAKKPKKVVKKPSVKTKGKKDVILPATKKVQLGGVEEEGDNARLPPTIRPQARLRRRLVPLQCANGVTTWGRALPS